MVHRAGVRAGAAGLLVDCGPRPNADKTRDTKLRTAIAGVDGALAGVGTNCAPNVFDADCVGEDGVADAITGERLSRVSAIAGVFRVGVLSVVTSAAFGVFLAEDDCDGLARWRRSGISAGRPTLGVDERA
ncbi:MAG TPA: hypothetical protein VH496_11340 [Mycobacterium sp.]|jgi:hypothetical protein